MAGLGGSGFYSTRPLPGATRLGTPEHDAKWNTRTVHPGTVAPFPLWTYAPALGRYVCPACGLTEHDTP